MAKNSNIEWCHHTFNPWIGCTKISPACDNCYAAEWDKRYEGGKHWGAKAPRRRTSEKNWNLPLRWDREAEKNGVRYRVFCASLADVFDNQVPGQWRNDLWELIWKTPHLDWLLLTKRPQNIKRMLPNVFDVGRKYNVWGDGWKNVWIGTTVEDQKRAEQNIPELLNVPAFIRFLSCEPLLGEIDFDIFLTDDEEDERRAEGLTPTTSIDLGIHWVITGGESGSHCRDTDPNWFRSLRDQCRDAGVPFFFKQWGGKNPKIVKAKGRELDGKIWNEYPKQD